MRRNWTEWKNGCTVFRRREVEGRGVFEALGIPKFAVLRGVAKVSYNVLKFAKITITQTVYDSTGVIVRYGVLSLNWEEASVRYCRCFVCILASGMSVPLSRATHAM